VKTSHHRDAKTPIPFAGNVRQTSGSINSVQSISKNNENRSEFVALVIGLATFLAAAASYAALRHASFVADNALDFKAFYCAGEAVLKHADPYRVEPLRACMHRLEPSYGPAWLVTPAPFPGYVLALFAALAKLPFESARVVWEIVTVVSVLVAGVALARLTQWSPLMTTLALIPTAGFVNLLYGETTPIVVAALTLGALELERGRFVVPALAAGVSLIEPHVGAPVVLALFLAVPRARPWVACVALTIAVVSVATLRLRYNLEYFRFELPLQAFSEVTADDQYSLTWLLSALGQRPATALALGSASYALMLALGVALSTYLGTRRRLGYVMLLPPAAVALGGTFVHDVQIAVAIPFAFLLACDVRPLRLWALGAVPLLLLPATSMRHPGFPIPALTALAVVYLIGRMIAKNQPPLQRALIYVAQAALVGVVAMWLWSGHRGAAAVTPPVAIAAPKISPDDYAPVVWGAYLRATGDLGKPKLHYIVEKIPGWFGLIVLVFGAARAVLITRHSSPGKFDRTRAALDAEPAALF